MLILVEIMVYSCGIGSLFEGFHQVASSILGPVGIYICELYLEIDFGKIKVGIKKEINCRLFLDIH